MVCSAVAPPVSAGDFGKIKKSFQKLANKKKFSFSFFIFFNKQGNPIINGISEPKKSKKKIVDFQKIQEIPL